MRDFKCLYMTTVRSSMPCAENWADLGRGKLWTVGQITMYRWPHWFVSEGQKL